MIFKKIKTKQLKTIKSVAFLSAVPVSVVWVCMAYNGDLQLYTARKNPGYVEAFEYVSFLMILLLAVGVLTATIELFRKDDDSSIISMQNSSSLTTEEVAA